MVWLGAEGRFSYFVCNLEINHLNFYDLVKKKINPGISHFMVNLFFILPVGCCIALRASEKIISHNRLS